jgi:hypothetical protein
MLPMNNAASVHAYLAQFTIFDGAQFRVVPVILPIAPIITVSTLRKLLVRSVVPTRRDHSQPLPSLPAFPAFPDAVAVATTAAAAAAAATVHCTERRRSVVTAACVGVTASPRTKACPGIERGAMTYAYWDVRQRDRFAGSTVTLAA